MKPSQSSNFRITATSLSLFFSAHIDLAICIFSPKDFLKENESPISGKTSEFQMAFIWNDFLTQLFTWALEHIPAENLGISNSIKLT
jgi:hypothetical protein